jgi:hypothetical protein
LVVVIKELEPLPPLLPLPPISFNEASELLKYCGFKEKYILTESGFEAVAI